MSNPNSTEQKEYFKLSKQEVEEQYPTAINNGKNIPYSELPKDITKVLSPYIEKNIKRVNMNWCDYKHDNYHIDVNCFLFQDDIKHLAKFKSGTDERTKFYIQPKNDGNITITFTIYK